MSKSRTALPVRDAGRPVACCEPIGHAAMSPQRAGELAQVFKALADPGRLHLLSRIVESEKHEACVCQLGEGSGLSQPTISHHLKILHTAGLLEREKRGVWVHYRASREALDALARFFSR